MRMLIFLLTVALAGVASVDASAQTPEAPSAQEAEAPAASAAEERAAEFVGVEGADAERIPGGALLLAAYGVVWVFLFFYLMRIRGLQRNVAAELERLTAKSQVTAD